MIGQQIGRNQEKNGGRHQETNGRSKWRSTPEKWRSAPGDKWKVEMEVDTRRKASVTLSTKISAAISAKLSAESMQISDNFPQMSVNFKLGD